MTKRELISIRITSQQKENIKKMGVTYSKIFAEGYNKIMENSLSELKENAKKHHDLYIHYNDLYIQLDDLNKKNNVVLDKICRQYIENRDVDKPSKLDENWIESRLNKLDGISKEVFLKRCKTLRGVG